MSKFMNHLFVCDCGDVDHQFIVSEPPADWYDEGEEKELLIHIHLLDTPTAEASGILGSQRLLTLTGITTNQNRGILSPSVYCLKDKSSCVSHST